MRKLVSLAVLAVLATPIASRAEWESGRGYARRGDLRARPVPREPPREAVSVRPAPVPYPAPRRDAPSAPVWAAPAVAVPFWLGLSWGWGYYPLWPAPGAADPSYGPAPGDDRDRVAARLDLFGAGATNAGAGTLALAIEGPVAGFDANVTALALGQVGGLAGNDGTLTLGSAHATWAFVSDAAVRLRLEAGASMLSTPATGAWLGARYADTVRFGPDVGVSGDLGLVGPVGLEGHARVTPFPTLVFDAGAAVVLRGGPLALSAGWRNVDVNGNGLDAPRAHFSGPEIGLKAIF